MQIILFGLSGVGKNFVGETIAKNFPIHFWDADEAITIEMRDYIQQNKIFTPVMRQCFTQILINKILLLQNSYKHSLVSQALYKEENRLTIASRIPELIWIHVQATEQQIKCNLKKAHDPHKTEYATKICPQFQQPQLPHFTLQNDNDRSRILKQFSDILNILKKSQV